MSLTPHWRLSAKCLPCARANGDNQKTCPVITHPLAAWARGQCFAYTEDFDWERKAEAATASYALRMEIKQGRIA